MILDDISNRAGLFVECATTLDSEVFRHRDLDAFDVVAVPDGLEQRIGEAKEDHVLDGRFAEVMVDAKD